MTIGKEINKLLNTREGLINEINDKGQTVLVTDTIISMFPKIRAIDNTGGNVKLLKEIVEGTITEIDDTTCTILRSYCLQRCKNLTKAKFTKLVKICNFAFDSCTSFKELVLDTTSLVYLENSNAFRYTLIENSEGRIYVPRSLITQYKSQYLTDGTENAWYPLRNKIASLTNYPG